MTIVHIVLVKIKSDVTLFKDSTSKLAEEEALKPLYKDFKWSAPVFDARARGYDWGLYSVFEDKDKLKEYSVHPVHVDFVNNFIKPYTEDILAYDFEI